MRRKNSSNSAAGCGIVIIIFLAAAFLSGGGSGAGLSVLTKLFLGAAGVCVLLLLALLAFIIIMAFKGSNDEAEAKEEARKAVNPAAPTVRSDEEAALAKARRYLAEERIIAGKLKSEDVRQATGRVLSVATKITNTLSDKPDKIAKSSQFLNYYLPTLGIILQKYKKVESSGVDITSTREKVISYMGDIERAMQKEYENLFESDILDLSVEMEAMTIACKRDGLLTDADLKRAYEEQTINLTV